MDEPRLYLHRLVIRDPLGLQRRARELRLPDQPYDPDFVLHSLLNEVAGPRYLGPFVQDPRSRGGAVLAYSRLSREALHEQAQMVAPPEIYSLVDWEATQAKPLPTSWPAGRCLGFRVRVSPIVRGPKGHGQGDVEVRKRRPEVDAYLAQCWQQEKAPDREAVYRIWLERELARDGAAEAVEMQMTGFRLKRAMRRDAARKAKAITRPDALFKGTLRVADAEAFKGLLARGVGRHRGFGFGMLLLTAEGG